MKPWLNVSEAAEYASLSRDTIYTACERGELRSARVSGRRAIRIRPAWIDAWLERHAPDVQDRRRIGSSPGAYEVRILDGDLRVRTSAKGSAEVRNYVTTLEAPIDLSTVDAGDYQLTLRREGGEWQMFPLRVR